MPSKGLRRKPLSAKKEEAVSYSVSSSCRVKHKVVSGSLSLPLPLVSLIQQRGVYRELWALASSGSVFL